MTHESQLRRQLGLVLVQLQCQVCLAYRKEARHHRFMSCPCKAVRDHSYTIVLCHLHCRMISYLLHFGQLGKECHHNPHEPRIEQGIVKDRGKVMAGPTGPACFSTEESSLYVLEQRLLQLFDDTHVCLPPRKSCLSLSSSGKDS